MPFKPPSHRPPGLDAAALRARREADRGRGKQMAKKLRDKRHYRRFRELVVLQRPVCEQCGRRPSEVCHHVRRLELHPEDLTDPEQVAALCKGCHDEITGKGG